MIENFAIIIGAMKAGTTTLFDHLAAHPAIAPASPKEPGFFAFEEKFDAGLASYEALFDFDAESHKWALEASTDYTKFPHASDIADRFASTGRHFKLIYVLRHPIARIQSHAKHTQHWRKELGQVETSIKDHGLDHGVSPVNLDASRYASQLDQYKEYFLRGDLLLVGMEGMIENPEAVAARVCQFLAIDPSGLPAKMSASNKASAVQRTEEPSALWQAARAVGPLRAAAKALIPDELRTMLRHKTRPPAAIEGRFKMTPEEEAEYLAVLRPDLIRLRDEYGVDIKAWWGIEF